MRTGPFGENLCRPRSLFTRLLALLLVVSFYGENLSGSGELQASQSVSSGSEPPQGEPIFISGEIRADEPFVVEFPPRLAKAVRIVIFQTAAGQACIDEIEIFGPETAGNLALAAHGARASARSCLPGYAIHRIEHLNDGLYGNSHSWIAATTGEEWAQIDLAEPRLIHRVVISRDREGKYHDRLPVRWAVMLSADGQLWKTVAEVDVRPVLSGPQPPHPGPFRLSPRPSWDELLKYAFLCERHTWEKIPAEDHLSPLRSDRPAVPGGPPYWAKLCRMAALERTLWLFEELLDRLSAKGLAVGSEREQLNNLRNRWNALQKEQPIPAEEETRLYLEARHAKRQAMFRDPDLLPLRRILFVKRHPYWASHNYSDILDSEFRPGGGVFVLEIPWVGGRLEPGLGKLRQLFDASKGIARDPVADFEAQTIYFAYRPEKSPRPGWQPYWHLMAVEVDGTHLRQLTDGPFHDYYPRPLPDGGLAFVSTRIRCRFLCWRPQAFVLFRLGPQEQQPQPLSFANLSEWTPSLLRDGRILWTRSEYLDKGADFGHTLWAIRPDGTHPELIFGNNTPNCYIHAHEMPGTKELCCTLISHGGDHNGPIALIDRTRSPFDPAAITNITPDVAPQYNMNWLRWECFRDPFPVSWEYILVSHAPADRFGIYVIDRYGNRELLYLDPNIGSMSPSPLWPRVKPPVLPPAKDLRLAQEGKAWVSLVNASIGISPPVERGKIKYIRICEEVRSTLQELPDGQYRWDHEPFLEFYATPVHKVSGPYGWPSYVAKASHGLVELDPDGSATFEVPAGKVLYFQVLDAELNELQRMRSVVQFQPGEHRSCIGCHEDRRSTPPLQNSLAARIKPKPVIPPPWGARPFSFEEVVQPVLDRHCTGCHGPGGSAPLDLTGNPDEELVPTSYRSLISGGWVHYFDYRWNLRHHKAEPMSFGTLQSRLWRVLEADHHGVQLSWDEIHALKCWIDLNCPLWSDYTYRPTRGHEKLDLGRE